MSVIARLIFACFVVAVVSLPGSLLSAEGSGEASRRPPTPATRRQEVWQAVIAELRQQGIAEAQLPRIEDIDMPLAPPALAGRSLRVASACWDEGPRRTQFRLECGAPGQCLPFLVYLHDHVPDSVSGAVYADGAARAPSCQLASGSHPAPPAPRLAAAAAPKPTVQTGERAVAVFLSSHMRMTASVTCLERGRQGEVIRVRAPDGHIFRARISGPALLEALPQ
jgi:hypothetical protein